MRAGGDERLKRDHARARTLVRWYYTGLLLVALQHLTWWKYYLGLREIQPLWPIFWAPPGSGRAAAIVLALFVGGALAAALLPHRRLARVAAFAGCLEFFAFNSSFGSIRHVNHLLMLTTFMLVFLPREPVAADLSDEDRRAYLRAFWGAQCAALLTYSMAGFVKLATGVVHLLTGQGGVLTPSAMALHAANSAIRFGVEAPLAGLAVRLAGLGLPIYLAVIYVELFSLVIAFRPRLHRAWAILLVLMHVAIGLTLNLFFTPSILVVGVLFLASPFAPASSDARRAARDLPLLGRLTP